MFRLKIRNATIFVQPTGPLGLMELDLSSDLFNCVFCDYKMQPSHVPQSIIISIPTFYFCRFYASDLIIHCYKYKLNFYWQG